jgi:hypothetical protein
MKLGYTHTWEYINRAGQVTRVVTDHIVFWLDNGRELHIRCGEDGRITWRYGY